ncbi:MAG: hypothetical protein U5R31_12965 [Acidimicrobiia bacterium]|nr:hypothetical protein [Acidimicrobiia bacterium]
MVAALFDELSAAVQSLAGARDDGEADGELPSPTPLHADLELDGHIREIDGRKIFTDGRILADGRLCAEAEGLFISIDPSTFVELKAARERRAAERTSG